MKKYQLLVDSPDIPMGTIAEYEKGFDAYKITLPCGAVKGHFKSTLVENRPTVWQLIEEPKPSFKKWRAKEGGKYWVNASGDICSNTERFDKYDNYSYLTGNYFQTREEAEAYKARQEAIGRVTHAIIEENEGWVPDWEDGTQIKHRIIYLHYIEDLEVNNDAVEQSSVIVPYCKTNAIALSIISSHKEDLDLIFNVKK